VQGMRHFDDQHRIAAGEIEDPVRDYIDGEFQSESQRWPVFSVSALIASPGFQSAAA